MKEDTLVKGRLYLNNLDQTIYRLIAFCEGSDDVLLANVTNEKVAFKPKSDLIDSENVSEDYMIAKTVGKIEDFGKLSRLEQKICRDRYCLINSLLWDPENTDLTYRRIKSICEKYKISQKTIRKYLIRYLCYGRIETLSPMFKRPDKVLNYDCKPKIRYSTYSEDMKETGYAVLIKRPLNLSIKGRRPILFLLIDTFTKAVLSYQLSLDDENQNNIEALFHRCLSINRHLPLKINAMVTQETWCSNLRNLSNLGILVEYNSGNGLIKLFDDVPVNITREAKGVKSYEELLKIVKNEVEKFNSSDSEYGLSKRDAYNDILRLFKDAKVSCNDNCLKHLFSEPYKAYFDKIKK